MRSFFVPEAKNFKNKFLQNIKNILEGSKHHFLNCLSLYNIKNESKYDLLQNSRSCIDF